MLFLERHKARACCEASWTKRRSTWGVLYSDQNVAKLLCTTTSTCYVSHDKHLKSYHSFARGFMTAPYDWNVTKLAAGSWRAEIRHAQSCVYDKDLDKQLFAHLRIQQTSRLWGRCVIILPILWDHTNLTTWGIRLPHHKCWWRAGLVIFAGHWKLRFNEFVSSCRLQLETSKGVMRCLQSSDQSSSTFAYT